MAKNKEYTAKKVLIHKGDTIAVGEPVKGLTDAQAERLKKADAIEVKEVEAKEPEKKDDKKDAEKK